MCETYIYRVYQTLPYIEVPVLIWHWISGVSYFKWMFKVAVAFCQTKVVSIEKLMWIELTNNRCRQCETKVRNHEKVVTCKSCKSHLCLLSPKMFWIRRNTGLSNSKKLSLRKVSKLNFIAWSSSLRIWGWLEGWPKPSPSNFPARAPSSGLHALWIKVTSQIAYIM